MCKYITKDSYSLTYQTGNTGIECKLARVKVRPGSSTLKGFLLLVNGEATPEKLVKQIMELLGSVVNTKIDGRALSKPQL